MGLLMSELMNHPEAIQSYTKSTYDKVLMSKIYKYLTLNYKKLCYPSHSFRCGMDSTK